MPKNLIKAIDIIKIIPDSLNTQEKLECLTAMGILREKLFDYILDSEEIFSYFKDILLESEANIVKTTENKELLMKIIDKRIEIFQSSDITRTKIQESFHLVMNLKNLEGKTIKKDFEIKKNNNWIHQKHEPQLKEILNELAKRNEEICKLKGKYNKKLQEIAQKNKTLASDLKRLKYCIEYELFNT